MGTRTNLEAHSLNSLSHRLGALVCRNTLKSWLTSGRLKPEFQGKGPGTRHLLFTKKALTDLHEKLQASHRARCRRLAGNDTAAAQFMADAACQAVGRLERNIRCETNKKPGTLRELSPALNDDDAQGLTKLTNQEKMKKIQTKWGI